MIDGAPSSWRPPWFESAIPSTPCSAANSAPVAPNNRCRSASESRWGNDRAAAFYRKTGWQLSGTQTEMLETSAGEFPLEVWRFTKVLSDPDD